jgi:small subunit ribosomal protein S4
MGKPKFTRKKYDKPSHPWQADRINQENELVKKYGLKNKREIWKADAAIGRIRNRAKFLITKSEKEKQAFIEKLMKHGFKVESIADALGLNKEDWMKRRLQTIIFLKKLAHTPKQARQLITHKHVSIGEQIVNIPSYQVSLEEEPSVTLNLVFKKESKKSKIEEIKEQVLENKEIPEVQIEKEQLQENKLEVAN